MVTHPEETKAASLKLKHKNKNKNKKAGFS